MRFAIFDNAGKGAYLRQRLIEAGHQQADRIDGTDVLILDCDWPWAYPRPQMIEAATKAGVPVVLYPHGGMPTVFNYDGIAEPDPRVAARLEHGPGSIDIARTFCPKEGINSYCEGCCSGPGKDCGGELCCCKWEDGFSSLRQHATGWLFSPTVPFETRPTIGRVLFAPMHPNIEAMNTAAAQGAHFGGEAPYFDPAPNLNGRIYRQLIACGYDLVVPFVGPFHKNAIWPHPRARLVQNNSMSFTDSVRLVAEADSVVAAGTLGALAVALGKPTVMFGQGDFSDYVGGKYVQAAHAGLYRDAARYPIDAEDDDVDALLARACRGDEGAAAWRAAFVGDDGTEEAIRIISQVVAKTGKIESVAKKTESQRQKEAAEAAAALAEDDDSQAQKNVSIGGVTARLGANA